jgi:hypothetical protein
MTTAMELAIKTAGLPVFSQQQRIWNWLRDHPKSTVNAVIAANVAEKGNVSSLVSQMYKRKMLKVDHEFSRLAGREVSHYSVATKDYTILPMPKKEKKQKPVDDGKTIVQGPNTKLAIVELNASALTYKPVLSVPGAAPLAPAPKPEFNATEFVNGLSLREAKAVYKELKELFE